MKFKKIIFSLISLAIAGGLVTIAINSSSIINKFNDKQQVVLNNQTNNVQTRDVKAANKEDLDSYIKDDIQRYNPETEVFTANGTLTFDEYVERYNWGGFGNHNHGSSQGREIRKQVSTALTCEGFNPQSGEKLNTMYFNWSSPSKLSINGSFNTETFQANYEPVSLRWYSPGFKKVQVPVIKTNINGENNDVATPTKNENEPTNNELQSFGQKNLISTYLKSIDAQDIINGIKKSVVAAGNNPSGTNVWEIVNGLYANNYFARRNFGTATMTSYYFLQGRQAAEVGLLFKNVSSDFIEKIDEYQFGSVYANPSIINQLLNIKLNLDPNNPLIGLLQDDNNKVWNSQTITNNTKRVLHFNQYFYYFKTLTTAAAILEQINNEVIAKATGSPLDREFIFWDYQFNNNEAAALIRKGFYNKFEDLPWPADFEYDKSKVQAFIETINQLKFPNYYALDNAAYHFFDNPNHPFEGIPINEGTYKTNTFNLWTTFLNGTSTKITLKTIARIYQAIIALFKNYNIVFNAKACNLGAGNNDLVDVTELDQQGNKKIKDIILWDATKGDWNYGFINDIGIDFLESNTLNFKISNIKLVRADPNSINSKANVVSFSTPDVEYLNDFKNANIYIKYRYNAIPFDKIIVSSYLDPEWYKYFSIFINYPINNLVHLNNGERSYYDKNGKLHTEKYYVNDFVVNDEHNVNNIIKKSLDQIFYAKVTKLAGWINPYNSYPIFAKILSGIGVGDLNKYFGFDTATPFFDLDSWENALSTFQIGIDSEHKRYPVWASSYENNTIFCIATINNWILQDGSHGDWDAVYRTLLNNSFKYIRNANNVLEIDSNWYGLSEIKPRTRIKKDGGYDSNGYFLIKINVGNSAYGNLSNYAYSQSLEIVNWDEIYDGFFKPANLDDLAFPYATAGTIELLGATNVDGSGRYWVNRRKKIVEKTFFKTETYYLNDWQLDETKLARDLKMNSAANEKFRKTKDVFLEYIRYSNKYSSSITKSIEKAIATATGERELVAQIVKYCVSNMYVKIDCRNITFNVLNNLQFAKWFSILLDYYGYQLSDVFIKRPILVEGERTKAYEYVLNPKMNKMKNYSLSWKIVQLPNTNFRFVNKNWQPGQTMIASLWLPNWLLQKFIDADTVKIPLPYSSDTYNPYKKDNAALFWNLPTAIRNYDGWWGRVEMTNYAWGNKLIKQDLVVENNILHIVLISLAPIGALILIAASFVVFSIIRKKKF